MITKQAKVEAARIAINTSLQKVAEENQANMRIAAHNHLVDLGISQKELPYKNAAFLQLIRDAGDLIGLALSDE